MHGRDIARVLSLSNGRERSTELLAERCRRAQEAGSARGLPGRNEDPGNPFEGFGQTSAVTDIPPQDQRVAVPGRRAREVTLPAQRGAEMMERGSDPDLLANSAEEGKRFIERGASAGEITFVGRRFAKVDQHVGDAACVPDP